MTDIGRPPAPLDRPGPPLARPLGLEARRPGRTLAVGQLEAQRARDRVGLGQPQLEPLPMVNSSPLWSPISRWPASS
jgi:hypothetical protein